MAKLIACIIILIIALGFNFLISWGLVALASACFGFAFAWKYVWLAWLILTFVLGFFRESKD